jgi:hypothetical protein
MPSALPAPIYTDTRFYYGDAQIPRDVMNLRQSTMETMRRMGTPVLLKRMYTIRDVEATPPRAQYSPAWDSVYKQARHDDPLSNGVGFASLDMAPGEWYDPKTFDIYTTDPNGENPGYNSPDGPYLPAPLYRGYGPGFLTYVILPDRPEDVFKLSEQGVLTRTQDAKVQLPWWPLVGDNDLMITVALDDAGHITDSYERYQLKMVTPITMRGEDQGGRREFHGANAGGNRYWVGQECEAVRVPDEDVIYNVETDR